MLVTAIAVHQAAHAVIKQALDLPFETVAVTVCGGEPSPDWTDPDVYCDEEHRLLAERHITALFAGAEAERRYRAEIGQDDDWAVQDAANGDMASAFHLAVFIATHPNADIGWARSEPALRLALGLPEPFGFPAVDITVATSVLDRGRTSAARLVEDRWLLVTDLAAEVEVLGGTISRDQVTRTLATRGLLSSNQAVGTLRPNGGRGDHRSSWLAPAGRPGGTPGAGHQDDWDPGAGSGD